MKIIIEKKAFNKNFINHKELIKYLEDKINNTEKHFSHLVINKNEVYNNFDKYISKNFEKINEIQIIQKTKKEFIKEILESNYFYIKNAVPKIENLSNKLKKDPEKNDWLNLSDLFEGLGFINNSKDSIDKTDSINDLGLDYELWINYVNEINNLKKTTEKLALALNKKDRVRISEILSADIVYLFNKLNDLLSKLIDK